MTTNKQSLFRRHRNINMVLIGFAFIASGVLIMGHNMGWISDYLYHILLSWPMILVLMGVGHLLMGKISAAIVSLSCGAFFLIPRVVDVEPEWVATYWPFFLIVAGVGMLLSLFNPGGFGSNRFARFTEQNESVEDADGYITAEANFSNIKYTVQSDTFTGAKIDVSFGSLQLDLRRTQLTAPETYITLNNSCGGVELYIPSSWNVVIEAKATFGGIDDKRFTPYQSGSAHKLIIRGNVSFGGVEIKS